MLGGQGACDMGKKKTQRASKGILFRLHLHDTIVPCRPCLPTLPVLPCYLKADELSSWCKESACTPKFGYGLPSRIPLSASSLLSHLGELT